MKILKALRFKDSRNEEMKRGACCNTSFGVYLLASRIVARDRDAKRGLPLPGGPFLLEVVVSPKGGEKG